MNQLTIQIESPSLLEQLKYVLSLMKGVKIIKTDISAKSVGLEAVPNAKTLAAMREVENGNDAGVVRMDNLESFMASMEK